MDEARKTIDRIIAGWKVLDVTPLVVREAVRGVIEHQLHYWDAQLWACAKLNDIRFIFTEDVPSPAMMEGVQFANPLSIDFDLNTWFASAKAASS